MRPGRIVWHGRHFLGLTAWRGVTLLSLLAISLQGCVGAYRSSASCPVMEVRFEGVFDATNLERTRGTFSVANQGATMAKIPLAELDGPLADESYISVYKRGAPGQEWSLDDPDFQHSRPFMGMLELRPGERSTFLLASWLFVEHPATREGEYSILMHDERFQCRTRSLPFRI